MPDPSTSGRVGFAVGTGRCGTTFLAQVIGQEPAVVASAYRQPLNDTFLRYCTWYGLPVDVEGFVETKTRAIREDLRSASYSFESTSYLALSLRLLLDRFDAQVVVLVRRPERVVSSYIAKGWFDREYLRADPDAPPSYQPGLEFHHFLGRLVPNGSDFERWKALTRVGRIAWYWAAVNAALLDQVAELPGERVRLIRVEDLDFHEYRRLTEFLGFESSIAQPDFERIRSAKPNNLRPTHHPGQWSERERSEFLAEVGRVAEALGYELDPNEIWSADPGAQAHESEGADPGGARSSRAGWWRRLLGGRGR